MMIRLVESTVEEWCREREVAHGTPNMASVDRCPPDNPDARFWALSVYGSIAATAYTLPSGYVGGLFRAVAGKPGDGYALLSRLVEHGLADHLDCLGGRLADIYAELGFVETFRAAWDEELKPPGWEYPAHDPHPDYIEMRLYA